MFLKTVAPVVAVPSEWSSPKSLTLPLCFNDSASDNDFPAAIGSSMTRKVQMIIDSLRSTQSSDMCDDVPAEANTQSGLDLSRHGGRKPLLMEALARPRRTDADSGKRRVSVSDAGGSSDSDDSVDRGIEEAIQEYLKEKVDHKNERDQSSRPGQTSKIQQGDTRVLESSKQPAPSNTSVSDALKGPKAMHPLADLKKKKPSKEGLLRKSDVAKSLPKKTCFDERKSSMPDLPHKDLRPFPWQVKREEDLASSSDDGIEEAIQKFQQEEKVRHESHFHSDSSSDDGIEEAILKYQQEQKEHKIEMQPSGLMGTLRPPFHPFKKLVKKKNNNNNKKETAEGENKASPVCSNPFPTFCQTTKVGEPVAEQQIHSTLSVNTTAELMCAEAILDISKTVMPVSYEPVLDLSKNSQVQTPPFLPLTLTSRRDEKSDESSVDSEEGIEQEIRKFLELKAKMHEQSVVPPRDVAVGIPVAATVPQKVSDVQDKSLRLSFSRKRKCKEEQARGGKKLPGTSVPDLQMKRSRPKHGSPRPVAQTIKDKPSSSRSNSPNPGRPSTGCNSSDKSSSFDSDEDLDAAIKDLLKTKKKVKKKVRDMKLKSRRALKSDDGTVLLAKPPKSSRELSKSSGVKSPSCKKKKCSPETERGKTADQPAPKTGTGHQTDLPSARADEDSSSVDSDDSIEQEIRRFLAEKAKVSSSSAVQVKQEEEEVGVAVSNIKVEGPHMEEPGSALRSDQRPQEAGLRPARLTTGGNLERTLHSFPSISPSTGKDLASEPRTCLDPAYRTGPQEPKCPVQHQNLFLMKCENYIRKEEVRESSPVAPSLQNRRLPLREVLGAVCPSPPTFSTGPWARPSHSPPNIRLLSSTLTQPPYNPSHLSCVPLPLSLSRPCLGASVTRPQREQAPVLAHHSGHVQNELERGVREVKEEEQERCIDETDVESGEDQRPDLKLQQSSQGCLSTCIDPGELITPYIALNTKQSRLKRKQKDAELRRVKKALQFVVPMSC